MDCARSPTDSGELRDLIEFLCQTFALFFVIVAAVCNLTFRPEADCHEQALWASLLGGCLGICTPGPVVHWRRSAVKKESRTREDDEPDGDHDTQQRLHGDVPEEQTGELQSGAAQTNNFRGPHEVGLMGFQYTKDWYNVEDNVLYRCVIEMRENAPPDDAVDDSDEADDEEEEEEGVEKMTMHVSPGHYSHPDELCGDLNRHTVVRFFYTESTRRFTIKRQNTTGYMTVKLSPALGRRMGWGGRVVLTLGASTKRTIHSPYPPQFDDVGALFVNCDLASESHIVGDQKVPLLRTIVPQGSHGQRCNYEPNIVDWLPLRSTSVHTIEVLITDEWGREVPFRGGPTIVKVHVRRVNPFK